MKKTGDTMASDFDRREDRIRIGDLGPGDVALIRNVASEAARTAVRETLLAVGIDVNNPLAAQGDFLAMRETIARFKNDEFREDMIWLRRIRSHYQGIWGKAALGALTAGIIAGAHALWLVLQPLFMASPPSPRL